MTIKTRKLHHNIDLMGLLLLNWGLQALTTDPSTTYPRIYFNTASGTLRVYNTVAAEWQDLAAGEYADVDPAQIRSITAAMFGDPHNGITADYADGVITLTVTDSPQLDGESGAHYLDRANHTGTQPLSTISDAGTAAAADAGDFDASGAAADAQAFAVQRANHTGTQLAATISDLEAAVGGIVNGMSIDATTLQGDTVNDIVSAAVDQITDGAGEAYDTLIEIQQFLESHGEDIGVILDRMEDKAKVFEVLVGDGAADDIVVTHDLGTRAVQVTVTDAASPYSSVGVYWEATTTDTITLFFPAAPAQDEYLVSVVG